MKRLLSSTIAFSLIAMPVLAQNASQIAAVKSGKSCKGCNLFQADFDYEDIGRRNLSGSRLRQSDMSLATADYANFAGADLSIANLYGIRATGANFSKANLAQASLVGGYFGGANFSGAVFNETDISGAEMKGAKGLTQKQMNGACGDEATELPKGLMVKRCIGN